MTDVPETAAETEELTHTFSDGYPQARPHGARPQHSDGEQRLTGTIAESVKLLRLRELHAIRERNRRGGSAR